jgi:hypothetical protein
VANCFAVSSFRACRSRHDPAQARALVRTVGGPRRRHVGARSAGGHVGGRARGAPDRRPARGTRRHSPVAAAIRRILAPLPRLLAARGVPRFRFSGAAGGNARPRTRAHSQLGGGGRARHPADPARRSRARGARTLAARSRRDVRQQRQFCADRQRGPAGAGAAVPVSAGHRAGHSSRAAGPPFRRRRLVPCAGRGHRGGTGTARAAGRAAEGPGARHARVAAYGHGAQRGLCHGAARRAGRRGDGAAPAAIHAGRAPRSRHGAGRRCAAAMGAGERAVAGNRRPVLLDHRLDQRTRRAPAGQRARSFRRARDPSLSAAAAGRLRAVAARQPLVGAALRGIQSRDGHAVAQRGGPERPSRSR